MQNKPENAKGGEAGHIGRDRQPAKDHIHKIKAEAPDEMEAATPREVKQRSDAAAKTPVHSSPDAIRPEPKKESDAD